MKTLAILSLVLLLACNERVAPGTQPIAADTAQAEVEPPNRLLAADLINWPRKTVVEIGCILETELGFRDSVFNCRYKNYVNKGDPCKNTTAYYEGIVFPGALAAGIHPSIKSMQFDFEGGRLREISITFKDSVSKEDIRKWFGLPGGNALPENIMAIDYGDNVYSNEKPGDPAYTKWLTLTGFEHMGAGDVDCE